MKQRNALNPQQKQTLRRGGQVLMAVILIGLFSYQINTEKGMEVEADLPTVAESAEQEISSQAQKDITQSLEAEQALRTEKLTESPQNAGTQATTKTLKKSTKAVKQKVLAPAPAAVLKTGSAVDYQGMQMSLSQNKCLLKWSSAYQRNVKNFVVERSIDDETYEVLGKVNGLGKGEFNTAMDFQFNDKELRYAQMPRVFYRIKHEGYDGSSDYSDVMEYDLGLPEGLYAQIEQVQEQEILIHYSSYKSGPINYKILNAFGQHVSQGELDAEFDPRIFIVEADTWEKGSYYLELNDEKYSLTQVFEVD